MIKVKIQYRNYKKLHNIYSSLVSHPPTDVEYYLPKEIKNLRKFYPIYKHFSDYRLTKSIIRSTNKHLFQRAASDKIQYDLIHFLHMLPSDIPTTPYIVDIQHPSALFNFTKPTDKDLTDALEKLNHPLCKKVIFLSNASWNLFKKTYPDSYETVEKKKELVYPATDCYFKQLNGSEDTSLFTKEELKKFKILLVGNSPINKGFLEAFSAAKNLSKKYNDILFIAITKSKDIPDDMKNAPFLKLFEPDFAREEMFKKVHLIADLFVFPTRGDTFGMAALEALACKLPVLATDQFALSEVIQPGINGYLLKSEYNYSNNVGLHTRSTSRKYSKLPEDKVMTIELIKYIDKLYNDRPLLKKLAGETLKDFEKDGRFNVEVRAENIGRIYEEVI